ncbi:MAG: T9SS type A sorting domain-containing protein [bacterium]|nr:MAG: T9SS type A sorting domain-containing protein [bacterium]
MKRSALAALLACLLVSIAVDSSAVDCWKMGQRIKQETSDCKYCPGPDTLQYCIVSYDFEMMNWQGWVQRDNTYPDLYWHADDYAGIVWAAPVPLAGQQSGWCGSRGLYSTMEGWRTPPGYANKWDQWLTSDPILSPGGTMTISYLLHVDSEPGNDELTLEYLDPFTSTWIVIDGPYSGTVTGPQSVNLMTTANQNYSFRFRFISDCACSDEDGCLDTDGGAHVDDIRILDAAGGVLESENFEGSAAGAKQVDSNGNGIWWRAGCNAYGIYSGLMQNLWDMDPCNGNFGTQVVFFIGSPFPSAIYPGEFDTPFCLGGAGITAPCQDEMIVSPPIDMAKYSTNCDEVQDANIPAGDLHKLGGATLQFYVYRDLTLRNLVFYYWRIRNLDLDTPIEPWRDRGLLYYAGKNGLDGTFRGSERDYLKSVNSIGDMVGGDHIQIALGVIDMCDPLFGIYGNCATHTPSPWFDNVSMYRYESYGPQWYHRSIDLFQDNFADTALTVRADAAIDMAPAAMPVISPRDWIGVTCDSPVGGGIKTNAFGPMVFMHVRVLWIGPGVNPNLFGPILVGSYGAYVSDDGIWTTIQGVPAPSGCPGCTVEDLYAFDLNDNLFTPGYMIEYYFSAEDNASRVSYLPPNASTLPNHPGTFYGRSYFFEFTCLPTGDSDILYVDDFHERLSHDGEVHDNFDDGFVAVLPLDHQPDRYDVNGPSCMVSNSLASRATLNHLLDVYRTIIWDSGNLRNGTICDGTAGDKSLDCQLLVAWLNQSPLDPSLWILGDNVACDLTMNATSLAALSLLTFCGVSFTLDSYYELSGIETPVVVGEPGSPFFTGPQPDTFCVYGSCPIVNAFDAIDTISGGQYALQYPVVGPSNYYAGIWNNTINLVSSLVSTMWFGFSYMYIRDCEVTGPSPQFRFDVMADVLSFFNHPVNVDVTGVDEVPSYSNSLAQNYPNPFNPTTRIDFSLRERGQTKLSIYNVKGQLVRVLVNETMDAGPHSVMWDATNNRGAAVASGIYFYRIVSKGFVRTKKMILLR